MLRYFSIMFLLSGLCAGALRSQTLSEPRRTSPSRMEDANVQQDIRELKELVGELRLAVEQLQRENEHLALRLARAEAELNQSDLVTQPVLARELASLQKQVNSQNQKQQEILVKELTALIKSTVSSAQVTAPATTPVEPVTFDENYPKNGVMYQVRPGDTISKIAQELGSTIGYIKNANKIADPKRLQVGDTLFIPIPNSNP